MHRSPSSLASKVVELESYLDTKKKYQNKVLIVAVEMNSRVDEALMRPKRDE